MAKEVIALILAGGQSTRLGTLTKKLAKPAFAFGGKYRIIDFTLSNCANSDINTVGVLTQFEPLVLNSYIGIGRHWDLDRKDGGVNILPPYLNEKGGEWYKGTANAVYQNMDYIDMQNPKYVLVLSGDHIYKMDYTKMIDFHKEKESEATITVIKVPLKEASRFGIMNTREDNSIYEFDEKPKQPKNNLASMGVYLFNWDVLKKYLVEDEKNKSSSHDFGKNIIPTMLNSGVELYAYPFKGYWKDVGTIESLWQANMDLLKIDNELNLFDKDWKIYSVNPLQPPQYVSRESKVVNSMISEGCKIFGTVVNSVLSPGVHIGKGAYVSDTVIMRNAIIRENTIIHRSIIGSRCEINEECSIGKEDSSNITVVPYDYFMEGGTVYE
ncbi:MAG: glucose-1-phosphate adenylyltransferase [Actinobacteria bacterium RBG_13_35_12]|jgi:glucose-1-phosphate adenylyltransferase|nr:MAG: glucose-1-phosphate adenylyltransferase [Actinobacteria bacterium RBG_13_35_12]